MDLTRIEATFKAPSDEMVSIVGCGAIGSQVAIQLAKLGMSRFTLYDHDVVEAHNFVNQAFNIDHIAMHKTQALAALIRSINPEAEITTYEEELLKEEEQLEGFVFLATDNPSSRRHCLEKNMTNRAVLGWFDCRTELWAVQVFSRAHTSEGVKSLLDTLDFTDEEAEKNLPRAASGCHAKQASGITSAIGAATMAKLFVDFVKDKTIRTFTRVDLGNFDLESYKA